MANCYVCGSECVCLCEACLFHYEDETNQEIEALQNRVTTLEKTVDVLSAELRALRLHSPLVKEV